ncbi:MAG: hypothetical protein ACREKH_16490, partial [Candidatus Rokuibacteriota bacterium]
MNDDTEHKARDFSALRREAGAINDELDEVAKHLHADKRFRMAALVAAAESVIGELLEALDEAAPAQLCFLGTFSDETACGLDRNDPKVRVAETFEEVTCPRCRDADGEMVTHYCAPDRDGTPCGMTRKGITNTNQRTSYQWEVVNCGRCIAAKGKNEPPRKAAAGRKGPTEHVTTIRGNACPRYGRRHIYHAETGACACGEKRKRAPKGSRGASNAADDESGRPTQQLPLVKDAAGRAAASVVHLLSDASTHILRCSLPRSEAERAGHRATKKPKLTTCRDCLREMFPTRAAAMPAPANGPSAPPPERRCIVPGCRQLALSDAEVCIEHEAIPEEQVER